MQNVIATPSLGVFIGRFQPFHLGHLHVITEGLKHVSQLLIVIGSIDLPRGLYNPFTFEERRQMIMASIPDADRDRVSIVGVADSDYWLDDWVIRVQQAALSEWYTGMSQTTSPHIALVGYAKDATSYYLDLFPTWGELSVAPSAQLPTQDTLSGTALREKLFGLPTDSTTFFDSDEVSGSETTRRLTSKESFVLWRERATPSALAWLGSPESTKVIPSSTRAFLSAFVRSVDYHGPCEELAYATHSRYMWRFAPYTPSFLTADAVVFQSGYVLMVKRAEYPGVGLWALPGGFVEPNELTYIAALRELNEETSIKVSPAALRGGTFFHGAFDAPFRSLRGRTVTHAYGINIPPGKQPKIKASKESKEVKWIHLSELDRKTCFEDHYSIIQTAHRNQPK